MATPKRGGSFNHYGSSNQHSHKKFKHDRPEYTNPNRHEHGYDRNRQTPRKQPWVQGSAVQPILTAKELRTGLTALLDHFSVEETNPSGDKDALYHARELRRILCSFNDYKSSSVRAELDNTRSNQKANVAVPEYIERVVRLAQDLPPLPPIVEPHLHDAVFTHRSAHVNSGSVASVQNIDLDLDYERLEFLGDAYIELIASRALYNRFPHVDVPELCAWRERLVENSNLGQFSEAYGFADRLKYRGQLDKGSKAGQKIVADIFEAYVAALVLSDADNGFRIAEEWLNTLWAPQLLGFKEKIIENPRAREELNTMLMVSGIKLKIQEEKPMTYDSNNIQQFHMGIFLTGWGYTNEWLGSGVGQNKAQAGVAAATDALKRNSSVLQNAARQKAELMKRKEMQKQRAEEVESAWSTALGEILETVTNIKNSKISTDAMDIVKDSTHGNDGKNVEDDTKHQSLDGDQKKKDKKKMKREGREKRETKHDVSSRNERA